MGRSLYSVYRDKHYRNWGYREFETYCQKEIGIKSVTAQKLLKSYYFLEKEEPTYVAKDRYEEGEPAKVPDYESVNLLRLAKARKLEEEDYAELKKKVLDEGRPAQAVKKQYREMVDAQKEAKGEEEDPNKRQKLTLRRFVAMVKSLGSQVSSGGLFPKTKIVEIEKLVKRLEEICKEEMD